MIIKKLYIYPIKSCAGISLKEMEVDTNGPMLDREFLLIDTAGRIITQRSYPKLATVKVSVEKKVVNVACKGHDRVSFFADRYITNAEFTTKVWSDICKTIEVDKKVSEWFSNFLNLPVRLVKLAPQSNRYTKNIGSYPFGFADTGPFSLINLNSLKELSSDNFEDLILKFRPNIVVDGLLKFKEESVSRFTLKNLTFITIEPCTRCKIINIDYKNGTFDSKNMLLNKLLKFRKKAIFGINLVHHGSGTIKVGDVFNNICH